jgi:hypothetical protein
MGPSLSSCLLLSNPPIQTRPNAQPKRHPAEIAAWSAWFEQLTVTSPDSRTFFNDVHRQNAPQREDVATWFDWLELDDFVTFGGRP